MNLHVRAEVASVVEVFAALGTGGCELPRALMDGSVVLVVAQLAKLLPALQAVEGLLPRMGPKVDLDSERSFG